jgi:hypothetical protein
MIDRLLTQAIDLPYEALEEYCRRLKITKLEVFGPERGLAETESRHRAADSEGTARSDLT